MPDIDKQDAPQLAPNRKSFWTSLLFSKGAYFIYGLLLSAVLILGIRYATYHEHEAHYHANFAVYINGQQEDFKDPQFYQEVKICSAEGNMTPQMRTHMHNNENGVIHVHDDGVTWGQFFENLGWIVGPDFIRTTDTLYTATDSQKLNIVLNGQNLTGLSSITNQLIDNKDRLLLSYGGDDKAALDKQFATVADNAEEYNNKDDPAGCSGAHTVTPAERLKNLF
jgi:hypothetical protein